MTPALAQIAPDWTELQRAAISEFITSRDNGRFASDRSKPELAVAVRLLYPASERVCRECDALFEGSAVTSTLYCEACLINWN